MITGERLAKAIVEMVDTLVSDFDVIEFLEAVTNRSAELSRSSAAGLLVADSHGVLQLMAASQESVTLLELFQLQNDQGPCLDCFHGGRAVVNSDLGQATARWPLFAPRAYSAGFQSVHAFPLRYRHTVVGALNLFSTDKGTLEPDEATIIQAIADVATIGLFQERTLRSVDILTEQLQGALNDRITIEQAKGVLARIHGIDVDAAFRLLRDYAGRTSRRLTDVAEEVVTDPTSHPELTTTLRASGH